MANEVKYLDLQGLTLYDQNIKEWGTIKNDEIKIKQTNGKTDNGTILVTPGGTTPATYYSAAEAIAYNAELEGALDSVNALTAEQALAYNTAIDGANKSAGDILSGEEAALYNSTLAGAVEEGDQKTAASTVSTNIEVNIDNSTIIQDPITKQLKVASAALVQYVGDIDQENKYAINISGPDANNEKVVSLDINANSNVIEKTTTGVLAKAEIHAFADPSIFGTNVREAYALTVNNNVLTGNNNDQVIKIYKDSSLVDIKLLHAVPATYYTAEEAAEYNTEHGLNPGDEGYKEEGDVKTEAVKPTYSKLSGWVDIAAALRTEENLALCYAYENVDGDIVVEAIQVGSFLRENEFKDGLQVNAQGEVSVKFTTEKVRIADTPSGVTPGSAEDTGLVDALVVDLANGVKLQNIQNAINYSSANAKTTITEVAADDPLPVGGAPKILVSKTVQPDGHNNYTITGQDLASETLLNAEVARAGSAETNIDSVVGLTKSSGSETRTYSNVGNYIGQLATNTVKSDIKALDTKLKQVSDKLDAIIAISDAEINSLFA